LEHYEATYDAATDTLVNGSWSAAITGTFTARRILNGRLLAAPTAVATSQTTTAHAANQLVDHDMTTYWATPNGKTIGEMITLTLAIPSRLNGMRLLTWDNGGQNGIPSRVTIVSRDGVGNALDTSDRYVPTDAIWQPLALNVDTPVAVVEITITETTPPTANRVSLNGIELFGLP
jgi:hypothetical protein